MEPRIYEELFRSDSGAVIAYPNKGGARWGDAIVIGVDGGYRALRMLWIGGDFEFHDISVADPVLKIERRLRRRGHVVILDGVMYRRQNEALRVEEIVSYPVGRVVLGLFRMDDGSLLFLSAEPLDFLRTTYRLYIGPGEFMRQVPVYGVETLLGRTYVTTADGDELVVVEPNGPDHGTSWGVFGRQKWLKPLDPDQFEITETEAGATIIEK